MSSGCSWCNYAYVAPAFLVLPVFLTSIVNTLVAGPHMMTIIFSSTGSKPEFVTVEPSATSYLMKIDPAPEVTHFFVLTGFAPFIDAADTDFSLQASIAGVKDVDGDEVLTPLQETESDAETGDANLAHGVTLFQPLRGYTGYNVELESKRLNQKTQVYDETPFPTLEFRLTFVPAQFTKTQVYVRITFTVLICLVLIGYIYSMFTHNKEKEHGQKWITLLIASVIAVNDPLYVSRYFMLGNKDLYNLSVLGQVIFSAALFTFWLVFADGMHKPGKKTMMFYVPKVLAVSFYVLMATLTFLAHGRLPDRLKVSAIDTTDTSTVTLVVFLVLSLLLIGGWLTILVAKAIYRLGWKKVEYIYTEREKSFLGITVVFVMLWFCGHLYRTLYGRRGSWMQLQLPFLALSNSYIMLLAHAFWPSANSGSTAMAASEEAASSTPDDEEGGSLVSRSEKELSQISNDRARLMEMAGDGDDGI